MSFETASDNLPQSEYVALHFITIYYGPKEDEGGSFIVCVEEQTDTKQGERMRMQLVHDGD